MVTPHIVFVVDFDLEYGPFGIRGIQQDLNIVSCALVAQTSAVCHYCDLGIATRERIRLVNKVVNFEFGSVFHVKVSK